MKLPYACFLPVLLCAVSACNANERVCLRVEELLRMTPQLRFTVITSHCSRCRLTLRGWSGKPLVLEASPNLLDWVPLYTTNSIVLPVLEFSDHDATNSPQRFYRLQQ